MTNRDRDPSDPHSENGPTEPTEDEVWRDLVARLERTPDLPARHDDGGTPDAPGSGSPAGADGAPGRPQTGSRGGRHREEDPADDAGANGRDGSRASGPHRERDADGAGRAGPEHLGGPRDYAPAEEDEGFVPEEPPSLAGAEPLAVLAWIGAVGAPIVLLLSALFWQSVPVTAVVGIIAVFIASTAFLILRLPRERDNDDDGAVV